MAKQKRFQRLVSLMNQGLAFQIEDLDLFLDYTWTPIVNPAGRTYLLANVGGKTTYLHKLILERKLGRPMKKGYRCDHIDRNPLNNVRDNLREVTQQENCMNQRGHRDSLTKLHGVWWDKAKRKFRAQANMNGKTYTLGCYDDPADAYKAAVDFRVKHFPTYEAPTEYPEKQLRELRNIAKTIREQMPKRKQGKPISKTPNKNNSGKMKWAYYHPQRGTWQSKVSIGGKQHCLGTFKTPEEAHATAYAYLQLIQQQQRKT